MSPLWRSWLRRLAIPSIVLLGLTLLLLIGLAACTKKRPEEVALDDIHRISSVTEMSLPENAARLSVIKASLGTSDGLERTFTMFRESDDADFRERLIYVCWELTFEVAPDQRDKLSGFFQAVLEEETNSRLRNWAAAGLVQCAKPGMETFFLQLCEEDEPSMWRHAVAGLLRIGSEPAIGALTTEVRARRGDRKFLAAVESIVSSQSQSLPRTTLAE